MALHRMDRKGTRHRAAQPLAVALARPLAAQRQLVDIGERGKAAGRRGWQVRGFDDAVHDLGWQAGRCHGFEHARQPDRQAGTAAEHAVRVAAKSTERHQLGAPARLHVPLVRTAPDEGLEVAVVVTVEPQRGQASFSTVGPDCAHQDVVPRSAVFLPQAARKIDEQSGSRVRLGAIGKRRQAAVRLAHHDAARDICPRLQSRPVERAAHRASLLDAVAVHIAAAIDFSAPGIAEALPHRCHDGVAALDEFAHRQQRAIARLELGVARRTAMIDDDHRERPWPGRHEYRNLEFGLTQAAGRDRENLFTKRRFEFLSHRHRPLTRNPAAHHNPAAHEYPSSRRVHNSATSGTRRTSDPESAHSSSR